jgi:hypothetical protein
MQSIKQLTDDPLSVGCMSCLYIYLHAKLEVVQTTPCLWVVHALSEGCKMQRTKQGSAESIATTRKLINV